MGGRKSKQAGTSFEVRVAKWFESQDNWDGKRNPLSGASEQLNEALGKHDVRSWHKTLPIFFQIECKKTAKDFLKIQMEWIEKIDFGRDEILVFAVNRSPLYVMIPTKRFFKVLGRSYEIQYDEKQQWYKGSKEFKFKADVLTPENQNRFHLIWTPDREEYTILLLEEFIMLRETADIDDQLSYEDQIKRLTSLDKAKEFEKLNLPELNYKQKHLLYGKLDQLESGTMMNPIAHANEQFWMKDSFVIVCPHCKEKIKKNDFEPK